MPNRPLVRVAILNPIGTQTLDAASHTTNYCKKWGTLLEKPHSTLRYTTKCAIPRNGIQSMMIQKIPKAAVAQMLSSGTTAKNAEDYHTSGK